MLNTKDIAVCIVLLIGCAALYWVTTGFEEVSSLLGDNVLPEQFPRLLLWIIAALALVLPIEHKLQPERWSKIDSARRKPIEQQTWISIAFLCVVVVLAPYFGISLTMFLICMILPVLWGERRWWLIVPFAVLFTAVVSYLFNSVLKVHFEPGIFSQWLPVLG